MSELGYVGTQVVVTGAAGGIGSAICHRLARDGARLWCVDLDESRLAELTKSLPGKGHHAWPCDITSLDAHRDLMREVAGAGACAGLAHAAATLRRRPRLEDITEEDWDVQIDTNLKATFFLNRAVAALLTEQGIGGAIVNFASQGWWTGGFGGSVVYAASKGGIVSMTRGLARSLAPHRIRVNVVAPGFVETHMMLDGLTEEDIAESVRQIPLGRLASPEEVGDTVAFLLGPDARYITGATLNVTGGQLMY
jgi:NAD(P)-dependent dehydrogenase (short-subunit alcohol dehydrogenase family)